MFIRLSAITLCCLAARIVFAADTDALSTDFVKTDNATGRFTAGGQPFTIQCVTYVQPVAGSNNLANAGPIHVLAFDLTRLRADFAAMRDWGINAIYMRVNAGDFLNREGAWRKLTDPLDGVRNAEEERKVFDARLATAAAVGIGPFTFTYEVFDYLLDCAREEGIYVVPMVMDTWGYPYKYDLMEKYESMFRENTWKQTLADWAMILTRYRDRKEILGYLIEGETFQMSAWDKKEWRFLAEGGPKLENHPSPIASRDPELTALFRRFLQERHGPIEALKTRWVFGYDRKDVTYAEDTGVPFYPFTDMAFKELTSYDQIELPAAERSKLDGTEGPGEHCPWWMNVPFDPVWLDFGYFKEWLYTTRLNAFMDAIRAVDPNHLFLHDASADFVACWHPYFVAWNHGQLRCDVHLNGNGYSSVLAKPGADIPAIETTQELFQTIASYRPSVWRTQGTAKVFGMGEGGLSLESVEGATEEQLKRRDALQDQWITSILMDNFGSGSGFCSIWDWGTLVSLDEAGAMAYQPALKIIPEFTRAMALDTFTTSKKARVLILANGPTLHGNTQSIEYNNLQVLASLLAMGHRAFDLATTDEISLGQRPGKVDISGYDAIFMPLQLQIPMGSYSTQPLPTPGAANTATSPWFLLNRWLTDQPKRLLVCGLTMSMDAYFAPINGFPMDMNRVIGPVQAGAPELMTGLVTWNPQGMEPVIVTLNDCRVQTLSITGSGPMAPEIFLQTADGAALGVRRVLRNGSQFFHFGFPLGVSWAPCLEPEMKGGGLNDSPDLVNLAGFYDALLTKMGIPPEYSAPPDALAYISDTGRVLMARRRASVKDAAPLRVTAPGLDGQVYADAKTELEFTRSGAPSTTAVTPTLAPNLAAICLRLGRVTGDTPGVLTMETAREAGTGLARKYALTITGTANARIAFEGGAEQIYTAPGPLALSLVLGGDGVVTLAPAG